LFDKSRKGEIAMLATVTGYYDGNQIVMNEQVKLAVGQELIITILEPQKNSRKDIDLSKYAGRGPKMFQTDAADYIKELRDGDRI
jgi:hypothetical protein